MVLLASPARADYVPPPLNDVVLASDVIVLGTIVSVRASTFRVRVRRTIAGTVGSTIEVERFTDWACASRFAPYATGQEVMLFLIERDGRYVIQSPGGEGEMPVVGGRVYVNSVYDTLAPRGTTSQLYPVYGGQTYAFAVGVDELAAAIEAARACFTFDFTPAPHRSVDNVRTTCDPEARPSARTPLARALFSAVRAR